MTARRAGNSKGIFDFRKKSACVQKTYSLYYGQAGRERLMPKKRKRGTGYEKVLERI